MPRLCLHVALSQRALKVSLLSLSSRLGSQGCSFHQGHTEEALTMLDSEYLWWVDKAESFHTPTVPKSRVIQLKGSQEVQRQSCVEPDTLPLIFLFPGLGSTPLLLPFFPHRNPYSQHLKGKKKFSLPVNFRKSRYALLPIS